MFFNNIFFFHLLNVAYTYNSLGAGKKDDDEDGKGGGGSFNCGGDTGFNSPGRFVC